ncbi:MAG: single-stranded-DNA-specific exonuclease RecJ, partial [Actinobacteria bacterium]|nr:single-stranded-DNA-specific exonuclease RecJ [Actinomycetota bacterium]
IPASIKNNMPEIPENWISIKKEEYPQPLEYPDFLLQYSEVLIRILVNRGIDTVEKINDFLKTPQGRDFYDPFLLSDMDIAVDRILKAVNNKEKILIFGDYDADGIISSALIFGFLKKLGIEAEIYIPDRVEDGYDISLKFVKNLEKKNPGTALIICVDCGSNSNEVKDYISRDLSNLDIIVCDHHKIAKESGPSAKTDLKHFIVVNPQSLNSKYPFKYLSGAGVTFKFINAILMRLDERLKKLFEKNYLTNLIDLVAISTIADLMPLTDENRLIVKWGLEILKNTKNTGIKKLIESVLPEKKNLTTYDIGFIIAPTSGRIENASKSLELLTCDSYEDENLICKINEFNDKRRKMQEEMLAGILENNEYDFEYITKCQKIFIEKSKTWHEGLLGIVASDLVRKLNIPVILFKEDSGKYKGSGRSIEEFDLFENLNKVNHFFEKFGGHKMACGVTLNADSDKNISPQMKNVNNYDLFKDEMIKIAVEELSELKIGKKYYYDMEIDFDDLTNDLAKQLKLLEPFGIGNSKPVFLIRNCKITDKNFLKNKKHVSFKIKNKGSYKKAIFFNINDEIASNIDNIDIDTPVSFLFNIDENTYGQTPYLQLVILDLFY